MSGALYCHRSCFSSLVIIRKRHLVHRQAGGKRDVARYGADAVMRKNHLYMWQDTSVTLAIQSPIKATYSSELGAH